MKYADMTNDQLLELFKDCWNSVYVDECYGTRDMLAIEGAGAELKRRGFELIEHETKAPEWKLDSFVATSGVIEYDL